MNNARTQRARERQYRQLRHHSPIDRKFLVTVTSEQNGETYEIFGVAYEGRTTMEAASDLRKALESIPGVVAEVIDAVQD